ncbi:type II secretion system F family protein [Sulfolobus sp. E5-1-F]|uniref:membrane pilin protein UpsF n=1 Tax=Saccharolobus sp. E5-1-F TaxID=2663019 RepID=UPI0012950313|nr:type II secretion system F family protein [Sulfolobus sp. E5-1-F]
MRQKLFEKINLFNLMATRINENIKYYGDDIEKLRREYTRILFLIPIISIISVIFYLKLNPYFLLLNIMNFFIYFYPVLITQIRKDEQRKIIENEIPIFLLFAYVNSLLGRNLYKTFEEIKNSKVFKGLRREAMLLLKEVEVLGKSSISAMESRAKVHRSDFLGKIYTTYTSGESIGISMSERLKDLLNETIDDLNLNFESYIEKVNEIVEILFMLFLVTPMILLAFQYISASIDIFELIFPLLLSPIIFFYISLIQPNIGYNIKINIEEIKRSLYIIPIPFIFMFIFHLNLEYKILLFYSMFVVFSFIIYRKISDADKILNNLPYILSDIADYLRIGYSIKSAILKLNVDSTEFRNFLRELATKIRKNEAMSNVKTNIWIINAILELMENIDKKGFADTYTFKDLSLILNNYISLRKKVLQNLRMFNILAIITPIIFYFALGIMTKIKAVGNLDLIIVLYSIALSIMYAKISRFTIFNFPLLVLVLVNLILILFFGNAILTFI